MFFPLSKIGQSGIRTKMCRIVAFVLICAGCSSPKIRTGDLVFFRAVGSGGHSEAISSATGSVSADFVHVAIIEVSNDSLFLIQADDRGVLREYWDRSAERVPYSVMRPDVGEALAAQAVERAKTYIGCPYDWYYLPDNGAMYCSELVYESYLDDNGEHIFLAKPMNFRAPDGSMPQFWVELYDALGRPVPEGVPGTNPNDMYMSPVLKPVN